MDITLQELKTMKAKQLRRLIREAITEVLAEADISPAEKAAKDAEIKALQAKKKAIDSKLGDISSGREEVAEGDIEEMARTAKGFRLADPNFDASPYANKRVSGASMTDIINFFRENPGAEKGQLLSQFGFVRPQIANAVVNGLLDAGVLVKLGTGGEVEPTPEPGEESEETVTGPEAIFVGSSDPLAQYFDKVPNDGGEEDFNTEEEPTAGEVGNKPVPTSGMTDKDYEDFMRYSDLKQRLDSTKSGILKLRRGKGGAGDIKDKPSTELLRLRDLKKSLEDRINALVAGSDYLKKRTGKEVAPEEITGDEETISEVMDEYDLRKLQYYAGIRQ